MSSHRRGRVARHAHVIRGGEVELQMECEEEELSPWQKEANRKAEKEYNVAMEKIKQAKAKNLTITHREAGFSHPVMPSHVTTRGAKTKNTTDVITIDDDDDVIIVDESPALRPRRNASRKAMPPTQAPITRAAVNQGKRSQVMIPQQNVASQQLQNQQQMLMANSRQTLLLPNAQGQYSPFQVVGGALQPVSFNQSTANVGTLRKSSALLQRVQPTPRKEIVTGTHGYGVKRGSEDDGSTSKKRQATGRKNSTDEQVGTNWVPLDEYYYGKKNGDPAYREEKGEFRFKCWYCHKMLYNNHRIMTHMQGHIDSEKQQNLDLSDLTQCKHCYKQFDTPFEMQCHTEKVHQNKSNVLVCRICEKDHDTQTGLRQHMRASHVACEMPYVCQLCNFRSSIYNDVLDHFKKRHDSSQHMLCFYCLKMFKINFSKQSGWGLTQNYYQHLQRHQMKGSVKKCSCCKLQFLNKMEAKTHKSRDHLPNYKGVNDAGTVMTTTNANSEQVMIKLPDTTKIGQSLKSLNAPCVPKVRELRGTRLPRQMKDYKCFECGMDMQTQDHYRKYIECSMCRYATTCNTAYSNHMIGFHSGNAVVRRSSSIREHKMPQPLYCLCSYKSSYGNAMANHLVSCSKRTSYTSMPDAKFFEYDDEAEDFNPFEPYEEEPDTPDSPVQKDDGANMTLFGALGLMKRAPSNKIQPKEEEPVLSSSDIIQSILDELIDAMFPAEVAVEHVMTHLLHKLDSDIKTKEYKAYKKAKRAASMVMPEEQVSPEFTGSRKWSAVRITDPMKPSKASIFGFSSEMQHSPDRIKEESPKRSKADRNSKEESPKGSKLDENAKVKGDKEEERPGRMNSDEISKEESMGKMRSEGCVKHESFKSDNSGTLEDAKNDSEINKEEKMSIKYEEEEMESINKEKQMETVKTGYMEVDDKNNYKDESSREKEAQPGDEEMETDGIEDINTNTCIYKKRKSEEKKESSDSSIKQENESPNSIGQSPESKEISPESLEAGEIFFPESQEIGKEISHESQEIPKENSPKTQMMVEISHESVETGKDNSHESPVTPKVLPESSEIPKESTSESSEAPKVLPESSEITKESTSESSETPQEVLPESSEITKESTSESPETSLVVLPESSEISKESNSESSETTKEASDKTPEMPGENFTEAPDTAKEISLESSEKQHENSTEAPEKIKDQFPESSESEKEVPEESDKTDSGNGQMQTSECDNKENTQQSLAETEDQYNVSSKGSPKEYLVSTPEINIKSPEDSTEKSIPEQEQSSESEYPYNRLKDPDPKEMIPESALPVSEIPVPEIKAPPLVLATPTSPISEQPKTFTPEQVMPKEKSALPKTEVTERIKCLPPMTTGPEEDLPQSGRDVKPSAPFQASQHTSKGKDSSSSSSSRHDDRSRDYNRDRSRDYNRDGDRSRDYYRKDHHHSDDRYSHGNYDRYRDRQHGGHHGGGGYNRYDDRHGDNYHNRNQGNRNYGGGYNRNDRRGNRGGYYGNRGYY